MSPPFADAGQKQACILTAFAFALALLSGPNRNGLELSFSVLFLLSMFVLHEIDTRTFGARHALSVLALAQQPLHSCAFCARCLDEASTRLQTIGKTSPGVFLSTPGDPPVTIYLDVTGESQSSNPHTRSSAPCELPSAQRDAAIPRVHRY